MHCNMLWLLKVGDDLSPLWGFQGGFSDLRTLLQKLDLITKTLLTSYCLKERLTLTGSLWKVMILILSPSANFCNKVLTSEKRNQSNLSLVTKSMKYSSDKFDYEMDFLTLQRSLSLESNFVAQRQVLAATKVLWNAPPPRCVFSKTRRQQELSGKFLPLRENYLHFPKFTLRQKYPTTTGNWHSRKMKYACSIQCV